MTGPKRDLAIPLGSGELAYLSLPMPMSARQWGVFSSILNAMRPGLIEPAPNEIDTTNLGDTERRIMNTATGQERREPFADERGWAEIITDVPGEQR